MHFRPGSLNGKSRFFFFFPVAGGDFALLYASKELDKLETANFDQKIGVQIIKNALKVSILRSFT